MKLPVIPNCVHWGAAVRFSTFQGNSCLFVFYYHYQIILIHIYSCLMFTSPLLNLSGFFCETKTAARILIM